MLFEPFQPYKSKYLTFGFAEMLWEINGYYKLRANIFCEEQKIFEHTDRDKIDKDAMHIICTTECMGTPDQVVGAVRIHEVSPAMWFGSRLAVHRDYRSHRNFQSSHLFNSNTAVRPFTMSIGAGLIFKAVSSAKTMGCTRFQAHVQYQNVIFFERLHWKSLGQVMLHGYSHHLMEADLQYYPESEFINEVMLSLH